jgi:cellobiose-specific phosphotransferase system component IIC
MYARPREKEFLIGHPAFYLAVYAAYNKWPKVLQLLLVMAASIGQGSLVQTFCHVRTPVLMSYVRAGDGFVLGAVLGIILLIVVVLLLPYFKKWQRSYLADE